ncbi:MAG: hypothetical protein PHO70_01980 [Candidatus Omnitrophica bacterium]|nr:hypothetical protein [Candidatus Omnitrophota bacterium]
MKYIKNFALHKFNICINTNSHFIAKLATEQLNLTNKLYKTKNLTTINFELEETNALPFNRSDGFNTKEKDLILDCWLKNIDVRAYPNSNLIKGKFLIPSTLSNEAIFDLLILHPLRHILKYKNVFLIHAAALVKNNSGILICGHFKSGKSTMAVKLAENGLGFLSDEFVIYDKGELFAFPLKIGLEENSIKLFPFLKSLKKSNIGKQEKISFDIIKYFPSCYVQSCKPKIIIFPVSKDKAGKVTLKPMNSETAFSLLCMDKDCSLSFEKNIAIRQKQIQVLAKLAEDTKSYYLSYSLDKIDEAAAIIKNLAP